MTVLGDLFIVLGHETRTRYKKSDRSVVTKTHYFIPCAKNTYEEAKAFADNVKGAYHTDIFHVWNPRLERTCRNVHPDVFQCSECEAIDEDWKNPPYCHGCGAKVMSE